MTIFQQNKGKDFQNRCEAGHGGGADSGRRLRNGGYRDDGFVSFREHSFAPRLPAASERSIVWQPQSTPFFSYNSTPRLAKTTLLLDTLQYDGMLFHHESALNGALLLPLQMETAISATFYSAVRTTQNRPYCTTPHHAVLCLGPHCYTTHQRQQGTSA